MKNANCYECKYRGEVPGDAHSCCHHPLLKDMDSNPFGAVFQMLSGKFSEAAKKLEIRGNPIGISRGWFTWPANFDPTWLTNCNGFEDIHKGEKL